MSSTTRRRALVGITLVALLALAGCGGGSSSISSSTPKESVEPAAAPTRVVSVYPTTVDALYDFGIDPVGVYDFGPDSVPPPYQARWDKATKIGNDGELDLAKIAALEPELIVAADYEWNTNYLGRLRRIAPTVVVPSNDWRTAAKTIAAAVGADEKLVEMRQELEQRSAEIRTKFAKVLAKYRWDLVQGGGEGGEFLVYGQESGPGGVLTGAGVNLGAASAAVSGGEDASYSALGETGALEGIVTGSEVSVLEAAEVIGFRADWDGAPKNESVLIAQPDFQQLAAVKAGRTVPLPNFLPQGYGDALALLDQLEAGLKQLAGR